MTAKLTPASSPERMIEGDVVGWRQDVLLVSIFQQHEPHHLV